MFSETPGRVYEEGVSKRRTFGAVCNNNIGLLVLPFRLNKMVRMKGGACVLPLRGTLQISVFCLPFPFLLILWDSSLFSLVCLPVFPAFAILVWMTLLLSPEITVFFLGSHQR